MISLIAIIAKNRAIGCQNKLLYNIPEDLKHFRAITAGHAVIMGENTFHSLNDKPLPNRLNIVLTKKEDFTAPAGCLIAHSLEESIKLAKAQNQDEIFFIGGGQVYAQALPLADKLYLTIVDDEPEQADTFFPDYGEFKNILSQEKHHYSGYDLTFIELARMKKKINKIYIAGALTHVNDGLKETYLKIAEICKITCDDIYVPHARGTDPINHPDVMPEEVWRLDERAVATSDLIIAYVGEPSLGTGSELEIARFNKTDIILWWFKGQKVSRLPRGNPAVIAQIEANGENDLYEKLNAALKDSYELKR